MLKPQEDFCAEDIENLVSQAARKLKEASILSDTSENLPWRSQRTPYRTFLAEFLLVRTRTDKVAELFETIVARYPDLTTLACAEERELSLVLEPLGLKKRVPYLVKAACYIVEHYEAQIPQKIDALLKIPGLGLYTATAIAAFAYASTEVPADVNILRFLSRLTGLPMDHPTKGSKSLRQLLPLLSYANDGPLPEKLLDFTRRICSPRNPMCHECPLQNNCTYASKAQLSLMPLKE